jgi:hypothetical protein
MIDAPAVRALRRFGVVIDYLKSKKSDFAPCMRMNQAWPANYTQQLVAIGWHERPCACLQNATTKKKRKPWHAATHLVCEQFLLELLLRVLRVRTDVVDANREDRQFVGNLQSMAQNATRVTEMNGTRRA